MRLRVLWAALLSLLSITSCGVTDSFGEKLAIAGRHSSHTYLYVKTKPFNTIIIDAQITDYIRQDDFLLILRRPAKSYECKMERGVSLITHYTDELQYWIVRVSDARIHGPFDEIEFNENLRKHSIKPNRKLTEQIVVSNTEYFTKISGQCTSMAPV